MGTDTCCLRGGGREPILSNQSEAKSTPRGYWIDFTLGTHRYVENRFHYLRFFLGPLFFREMKIHREKQIFARAIANGLITN